MVFFILKKITKIILMIYNCMQRHKTSENKIIKQFCWIFTRKYYWLGFVFSAQNNMGGSTQVWRWIWRKMGWAYRQPLHIQCICFFIYKEFKLKLLKGIPIIFETIFSIKCNGKVTVSLANNHFDLHILSFFKTACTDTQHFLSAFEQQLLI